MDKDFTAEYINKLVKNVKNDYFLEVDIDLPKELLHRVKVRLLVEFFEYIEKYTCHGTEMF